MSITVYCSSCGAKFRLEDRFAGRRFSCKQCGASVEAPAASTPAAPQTAEPFPTSSRPSSTPPSGRSPSGTPGSASQSFTVYCPGCGNATPANNELVGKRVRCKLCDMIFRVEDNRPSGSIPKAIGPAPTREIAGTPPAPRRRPAPVEPPKPSRAEQPYDVLAGIDDFELSAPSAPLAPLAPLPKATESSRFAPQRLRDYESPDEGSNLWSIVALVYAIVVTILLAIGFATNPPLQMIAPAYFLCVVFPDAVCYLIALVRIGRYGSVGLAVLCFVLCCGLGQLIALAMTFSNKEKWRMEHLLPVWATLVFLQIGLGIAGTVTGLVLPAVQVARDAAEKAQQRQQGQPEQLPPWGQPNPPPAAAPAKANPAPPVFAPPNVDAAGAPAAPVVPPRVRRQKRPAPTNDAERIDQALEDIKDGDIFEVRKAVRALIAIAPNERRAEVAKALEAVLVGDDSFVRNDALTALAAWGSAANAPAVVRLLDDSHVMAFSSAKVLNTLAALKDPRSAKAITKLLFTRQAQEAITALKEMGPAAEDAVIPLLDHKNPALRREMCGVLEEIGTSKSIPELKKRSTDRGEGAKEAARRALAEIRRRGDDGDAGNRPAAEEMLQRVPK